jgi:ATP-dependent RNA helicase RhlE
LIFVNTKQSANELYENLKDLNIKVIHGDIEYQERSKSIKNFKNGSLQALIATDIAGRGIDIKSLPCVINYELPEKTDDFTHRVGRTGRANNRGEVVSILTTLDYNHFTKIERDLRLNIKREVYEGFELKDRQPRQKQMKKKSLSQKKGKKEKKPAPKTGAKSKKTTKRDPNRNFRR